MKTDFVRIEDRHPMDPPNIGTLAITPFVDLADGRVGMRSGHPIKQGQILSNGRLKVIAPHHEGTHIDLPDHVFSDDRPLQWFTDKGYFDSSSTLLIYAPGAEQICLSNLPRVDSEWIALANNLTIITEHGFKRGKDYFKNIPLLPDLAEILDYFPNCKVVAVDAPSHDPEYMFFTPEDAGRPMAGRTLPNTRALLEQEILPLSNLTYFMSHTSMPLSGKSWYAGKRASLPLMRDLRRQGPGIYYARLRI